MPRDAYLEPRAQCSLELLGYPWMPRAAHFEPRALCSLKLLGSMPRAAHFEPRALCSIKLLGVPLPLVTARRSLPAARPLQPRAARRPLGRPARLTSNRAICVASSCSATLGRRAPLTSSRTPFAASSCSASLDAARRSLRAARPVQPRAAQQSLDAAHRSLRAARSVQPRAARRFWTPRAAHFELRALCSLQLLGDPLDAARRSIRAARHLQPRTATRLVQLKAARRPTAASRHSTSERRALRSSPLRRGTWPSRYVQSVATSPAQSCAAAHSRLASLHLGASRLAQLATASRHLAVPLRAQCRA